MQSVRHKHHDTNTWYVYDMLGTDKIMPMRVMEDVQWALALSWYEDLFLVKNETSIVLGKIDHQKIILSSSSTLDASPVSYDVYVNLRSEWARDTGFLMRVIFLEKNAMDMIVQHSEKKFVSFSGVN